jgi:hypothetical protein
VTSPTPTSNILYSFVSVIRDIVLRHVVFVIRTFASACAVAKKSFFFFFFFFSSQPQRVLLCRLYRHDDRCDIASKHSVIVGVGTERFVRVRRLIFADLATVADLFCVSFSLRALVRGASQAMLFVGL